MTRSSFCSAIAIASVCAWGGYAQISTATMQGVVTDPSGGLVSGAVVKATNRGTQIMRSTVTGSSGEYTLSNLPAAHVLL